MRARISRGMASPPPHGFPGSFQAATWRSSKRPLERRPLSSVAQTLSESSLDHLRHRVASGTGSRVLRLGDLDLLGYARLIGSTLRVANQC